MTLTLKDKNGLVKAEFGVSDNSVQEKELHGDNVLNVSFTLYEYIPIDVTDYVDYEGERYWAMGKYQPQEKSSVEWEYSFSLYGIESVINRFLVINYTDGGNDPEFTLTAPAADHARLIVKSINEGLGEELFSVGTVVSTGNIVIDYKGKYCVEGLSEVAKAADTEYWFDGYMLNLCRCERGEPLTMGYGNGLTRLSRDTASGSKFWTRLFPIGSTRNIDVERYGHSRLQLPGGARYVDKAVDKYGVWHHYEEGAFADIYPRRVGTVSSVRSEEKSGQDGKTFTIWYFKDNGLNFDPNDYEIGGLVKRVSFQEGSELAGLGGDDGHYFEVNYDSQKKEFEIITIWPYDDDTQLPGGMLVPKVGDEYILWNIRMPDSYYTLAEEELAEAVDQYIEDHWKDNSVYKGATDHVWVEERAAALYVGRRIRLESQEYFPEEGFRLSRITKVTRNVNLPSSMDIEISDSTASGFKTSVSNSIAEVKNYAQRLELTFPDIIKTGEEKTASDYNVWSALRSLREFLSTSREGSTSGLIGFVNGLWVKTKGLFGIDKDGNMKGLSLLVNRIWGISTDGLCKVASLTVNNKYGIGSNGNTTVGDISANSLGLPKDHGIDENGDAILHNVNTNNIVTKTLTAQEAHFFNLVIDEAKSAGGQIVISPANAEIVHVVQSDNWRPRPGAASTPVYILFFKAEDGTGKAITNQFATNDLVLHMEFNVTQAQTKKYWYPVIAGTYSEGREPEEIDLDGDGEDETLCHYIVVSQTGKEDSGVPQVGDGIVVLGNTTDASRRNAIVISAYNIPFIDSLPFMGDAEGIKASLFVEYSGVGEDGFNITDDMRRNVIARNGTRLRGDFMVYNSFAGGYTKVESLIQALENAITLRVASTSDALRGKQRNLWWNGDFLFWGEKLPLYHWYLAQGQSIECLSFEKITSELPAGFSTGIRMTLNEGYSTYTGLIGCSWDLEDARYKQPYFPLEVGKTYTFSFYARAPKNSSLYIELDTARYQALTSEWKRYSYSFTAVTSGAPRISIMGVQVGDYYLTGIQLEEGDTLTEWQPVIERMADMADSIAELKVASGEISATVSNVITNIAEIDEKDSVNLIPQSTFPYGQDNAKKWWDSLGSRARTSDGESAGVRYWMQEDATCGVSLDSTMGACLYAKEIFPSNYIYYDIIARKTLVTSAGVENLVLEHGAWYTLSWWQKRVSGGAAGFVAYWLHDKAEKIYIDGIASESWKSVDYFAPSYSDTDEWVRHTITFKTRAAWVSGETVSIEWRLHLIDTTSVQTPTEYWITRVQLEKGKKATEWKPAGEDLENRIHNTEGKIDIKANEINGTITNLNNGLEIAGVHVDATTPNNSEIRLKANKVKIQTYTEDSDATDTLFTTVEEEVEEGGQTVTKHRAMVKTDYVQATEVVTKGLQAQTIDAENATIENLNVKHAEIEKSVFKGDIYTPPFILDEDNIGERDEEDQTKYKYLTNISKTVYYYEAGYGTPKSKTITVKAVKVGVIGYNVQQIAYYFMEGGGTVDVDYIVINEPSTSSEKEKLCGVECNYVYTPRANHNINMVVLIWNEEAVAYQNTEITLQPMSSVKCKYTKYRKPTEGTYDYGWVLVSHSNCLVPFNQQANVLTINGRLVHKGGIVNKVLRTQNITIRLTTEDSFLFTTGNSSKTIYLPNNPAMGQTIHIRICGSHSITVYPATSVSYGHKISNNGVNKLDNWSTNNGGICIFVWDGNDSWQLARIENVGT